MKFYDLKEFCKRRIEIKELYNQLTNEEKLEYDEYIISKRLDYEDKMLLYLKGYLMEEDMK